MKRVQKKIAAKIRRKEEEESVDGSDFDDDDFDDDDFDDEVEE